MDLPDNSNLEQLLKMDINTADDQNRFLEKLKKSQLIMPVEYSNHLNDVEGHEKGFSIIYLTDSDGKNAVPLFTSEDMMKRAGVESSSYVLFMKDLADLLAQTGDKYSLISINPFTDLNINMEIEAFLNLFREDDVASVILDLILNNSIELEEKVSLVLRDDENFMRNDATGGVYKSSRPLNINSDPHFREDLKYTNILLFGKSKKLLYLGELINGEFDIIVAPETEFEFVKDLDEFTSLWKCGSQPFYD